ncbi:hypothetical protein [Methylobacter svalbardensis]|uniref:hypothetical protein n=1 Tax=Methylobacter svalbardensis TaxID=3080016 RepID=UPI0030ED8D8F
MNAVSATSFLASKKLTLSDPDWVRYALIGLTLSIIGLFLILPLLTVLIEAFAKGWTAYSASLTHPDALAAMRLTLLVAVVTVPLTTVFGVSAALAIARFDFRGKSLLITLIDLPFSVSPVIAGLVYSFSGK